METYSVWLRILTVLSGIAAGVTLLFMGFEWIYNGLGLNPWLAFPAAVAFIMLPCGLLIYEAVVTASEQPE